MNKNHNLCVVEFESVAFLLLHFLLSYAEQTSIESPTHVTIMGQVYLKLSVSKQPDPT